MLSLGEAGTMIMEAKPGNHGMKEAAARTAAEATAAGATITRRDAKNLTAVARGITSPHTALRHHHPVREAEAEAEGQGHAHAPPMAEKANTAGPCETL
jgi:hypothetical protein